MKSAVAAPPTTRVLTLLDWKTGAFRSLEEHLQLGAYAGCTHRLEANQAIPLTQRCTAAQIIHVWEEGCKAETKLDGGALHTALTKFLHAKDIFDWLVSKGQVSIPDNQAYQVDGKQYPSVTFIISQILAKPNLLNWAYEMGVGAGLRAEEHCTPKEIAAAIAIKTRLDDKSLKKTDPAAAPWKQMVERLHEAGLSMTAKRDGRAGQGSTVHKNILFYLRGQSIPLEQAPPWLAQSMGHFALWAQKVNLEVAKEQGSLLLEQKLVNEEFGFCGTCDAIGWINGGKEA